MFPFSISLTVAKEDVNRAQHVSFDKYFVFFHEARIAYFAKMGVDLESDAEFGSIIADARCTYKKELRIDDVVEVRCRCREIMEKSLVMEFLIASGDGVCAEGSLTVLCFDYRNRCVRPFPEDMINAIKDFEKKSA